MSELQWDAAVPAAAFDGRVTVGETEYKYVVRRASLRPRTYWAAYDEAIQMVTVSDTIPKKFRAAWATHAVLGYERRKGQAPLSREAFERGLACVGAEDRIEYLRLRRVSYDENLDRLLQRCPYAPPPKAWVRYTCSMLDYIDDLLKAAEVQD